MTTYGISTLGETPTWQREAFAGRLDTSNPPKNGLSPRRTADVLADVEAGWTESANGTGRHRGGVAIEEVMFLAKCEIHHGFVLDVVRGWVRIGTYARVDSETVVHKQNVFLSQTGLYAGRHRAEIRRR